MAEKILILRVAPWSLIEKIIKNLFKKEKSEIIILSQNGLKNESELFHEVKWCFSKGNSIRRKDIKNVLSQNSIKKVIIPYNDILGEGYYKYELILFSLFQNNVFFYNINERLEKLNWLSLAFRRIWINLQKGEIKGVVFGTLFYYLYSLLVIPAVRLVYAKKNSDYDLIFITHFGYDLPSARVRSYNFSRELNKRYKLKTKVISMPDTYNLSNEGILPSAKFKGLFTLTKELVMNKNSLFCILKPDYHSFAVLAVSKLCGNKIIFDQDDWDFHLKILGFLKEEDAVRSLLKVSSLNITASNALKQETEKRGYEAFYIPTSPDLEKFYPKEVIRDDKNVIFSWIGMIWGKTIVGNISFILKCFREANNSNLYFHFAAGGMYAEYVRRRAERILGERQKLFKWIPPDEIPSFINSTDIGIMPFIGRPDYNRAKSPTKLFEYMACGKPCIVSDVGEMPYIIKHGENGFLAKTKQDFAEYMNLLANDKALRMQVGQNARKTIEENFSLEKCADEFVNILKLKNMIEI